MSAAAPLRLSILAAGIAAFFTLGVIQAMYGPAFPWFQQRFGLSNAAVALIASTHFLGSGISPLLAGLALQRMSVRRVTVLGLLVLAAGMALVAFAPLWPLALTGSLIGGLGLGGISAALNSTYAAQGTRAVNLVNAVFGVGSILSPLVVAALAPRSLSLPFLVVAALCALSLLVVRIWNVPPLPTSHTNGDTSAVATPPRLVALFALLLGSYVALEVGFGAWIGKHLGSLGWQNPALIVSLYWGGLTLGRVLTGLFGERLEPRQLVLGAILLATFSATLVWLLPAAAAFAYPLAGFALGPVFATTLVWLSRQLSPRLVPYLLVSGSLGGMLSPTLLGWAATRAGFSAIPATLALIGLALLVVIFLLWQQEKAPTQTP